jgi:hypothetical protein
MKATAKQNQSAARAVKVLGRDAAERFVLLTAQDCFLKWRTDSREAENRIQEWNPAVGALEPIESEHSRRAFYELGKAVRALQGALRAFTPPDQMVNRETLLSNLQQGRALRLKSVHEEALHQTEKFLPFLALAAEKSHSTRRENTRKVEARVWVSMAAEQWGAPRADDGKPWTVSDSNKSRFWCALELFQNDDSVRNSKVPKVGKDLFAESIAHYRVYAAAAAAAENQASP